MSAGTIAAHFVNPKYATEVLADSPLLYWKLDETAGTTAADSSGNSRSGTHTGGVATNTASLLVDGSGKSAQYPGTASNYTRIPYAAWMNVSAFTVEARVYPFSGALGHADVAMILGRDGAPPSGGNRVFSLHINSTNKFQVFALIGGVNKVCVGSTTVAANTAYTVAAKYDGTTLSLFVNGIVEGTLAASGALATPTSASDFLVGNVGLVSNSAGYAYAGLVDEVSWHSVALADGRLLTRHTAAVAA